MDLTGDRRGGDFLVASYREQTDQLRSGDAKL